MIQFNELRIIEGKLIIDASVKNLECFQHVIIDKINIDNQDTFSLNGPSDNTFTVPNEKIDFSDDRKSLHVELTQSDFPDNFKMDIDLFFVYMLSGGYPEPNTPCGMDKAWSAGAVANLQRIYNKGISYIKELSNSCEIPTGFADFILKYKAFVLSIRACDFQQAIKFWRKFFSKDNKMITKGCGCHGYRNN